jgi:hypothetical protein
MLMRVTYYNKLSRGPFFAENQKTKYEKTNPLSLRFVVGICGGLCPRSYDQR